MVRPLALKRQPAHFSINVFWAGQTFYYNFTLRLRRSSQAARRGFVGRIFGDNDSLRILLEQLSETFKASLFGKRRWLSINKFFRAMFCLLRSISFTAGGRPRSTNNMPSYGAVVTALFALESKGRVVEELSPGAHPVSIESGCALSSRVGACPVRTSLRPPKRRVNVATTELTGFAKAGNRYPLFRDMRLPARPVPALDLASIRRE